VETPRHDLGHEASPSLSSRTDRRQHRLAQLMGDESAGLRLPSRRKAIQMLIGGAAALMLSNSGRGASECGSGVYDSDCTAPENSGCTASSNTTPGCTGTVQNTCETNNYCSEVKGNTCTRKDVCVTSDDCQNKNICGKTDICMEKNSCDANSDSCGKLNTCETSDSCNKNLCIEANTCETKDTCSFSDSCQEKNICEKEDFCSFDNSCTTADYCSPTGNDCRPSRDTCSPMSANNMWPPPDPPDEDPDD
jgi:hypothetical protein